MKRLDKLELFLVVLILIGLFVYGLIGYKVVQYVDTHGLKSIVAEIWEGENNANKK